MGNDLLAAVHFLPAVGAFLMLGVNGGLATFTRLFVAPEAYVSEAINARLRSARTYGADHPMFCLITVDHLGKYHMVFFDSFGVEADRRVVDHFTPQVLLFLAAGFDEANVLYLRQAGLRWANIDVLSSVRGG